MRNLKRVLSLALALVMVLGMMVITTSAADFGDAEEITYTEAVDVISAIGVITGDNGSFYPNRALTREEGAALICYLLMGKDAADKLSGSGNFADVKADRWSAGEIDYCANLGIIKGYTDANGKQVFNPKGELTAVAYGRMLLGALGYDGDVEGYTGGNWASAIAADMIDIGLDVKGVAMDAVLTREQAAQMSLQALECNMVKYASKGSSISINGIDIVTGASEAEARTWKGITDTDRVDYNGNDDELTDDDTIQFVEKYFSNLSKNSDEKHGRAGYTWNITGKPAPVSEFVITDKVLVTVTDGIADFDKAADKTDKDFIVEVANDGTDYTATFYINGTSESITTKTVGSFADTTVETAIAKVGVIVEFIDKFPFTGKADVVNVIEKGVATLTADAATKEVKGLDTQVIVPGVVNTYSTAKTVKNVVGYEGLKKGDVVLTYTSDGILFIEKADKVSGKVSGTASGDKIIVNGEQLDASNLTGVDLSTWTDFKNSYDFYLDNNGSVVKFVQTTEEVAAVYAIPVDTSWVTGTGKIDEDNYAEAKLLFVDGTTQIVTVTKVDGKTVIDDVAMGTLIASDEIEIGDVTKNVFYTYEIDKDGCYELTTIAKQNGLDTTTIETGKANFDGTNGGTNNNVASAATTFIVKTVAGPKVTYTVYKGIDEIPNMTADSGAVIYDRSGLASYAYIYATNTSGSNNDFVVIVPGPGGNISYTTTPNAMGTGVEYYTVKAVVNGVEQDIKLKGMSIADNSSPFDTYSSALAADTLYMVGTIDAKGVITGLDKVATTNGIQVTAGTLKTGADSYIVDANTVIYYIDDEGAATALDYTSVTADKTDDVKVVDLNSDGKAELVYILQDKGAVATVDEVMYSIDGVAQTPVAPADGIQAPAGSVVTITGVKTNDEASYTISSASFTVDGTLTIGLTSEDGLTETTATCDINFVAAEEPVDYTGSEDDNTAYVGLDLTERFGVVARFVFEETTSADELVAVLYSGKTVLAEATYTANGGVFEGTSIGLTFNGKGHDSGSWTGENFVEDDDLVPNGVALFVDGVEYVKYKLTITDAQWTTLTEGSCLCGDC